MDRIQKEIQRGLELLIIPLKKHYLSLYRSYCVSLAICDTAEERKEEIQNIENFKDYFMRFIMGFTYYNSEADFYEKLDIKKYNAIESGIFETIENESGYFEKYYMKWKKL